MLDLRVLNVFPGNFLEIVIIALPVQSGASCCSDFLEGENICFFANKLRFELCFQCIQ